MPHPRPQRTLLVALLVAAPFLLASTAVLARSGPRVQALRTGVAAAERAAEAASAAIARLEPHAVESQLAAFDQRRALFAELARERRNRLFAFAGLVLAVLAFAGVILVSGVASEEEDAEQARDIRPHSPADAPQRKPPEGR